MTFACDHEFMRKRIVLQCKKCKAIFIEDRSKTSQKIKRVQ